MSMEDYNFAKAREAWATPVKIVQYNCTCGRTMKFESEHGVIAPQRTWQGLTDEEILSDDTLRYYYGMNGGAGPVSEKGKNVIASIEAKLKQKNGFAEEKNT